MSDTDKSELAFGNQIITCKLCIRLLPQRYCKRHTPKTTITRTRMYTQEQVDQQCNQARIDERTQVYYVAHDILADKKIPRHAALEYFEKGIAKLTQAKETESNQ